MITEKDPGYRSGQSFNSRLEGEVMLKPASNNFSSLLTKRVSEIAHGDS